MELKTASLVFLAAVLLSLLVLKASWAISDRNIMALLPLPDVRRPVDICYGDGSVWVLDAGGRSVIELDSSSREVSGEFAMPSSLMTGRGSISLSGFRPTELLWAYGKLWVAGNGLHGAVLLFLDPSNGTWGAVEVPNAILYSYGPVVGGWCLARGGGRVWTLVGTTAGALVVEVDPHALAVVGYSASLPGGADICYGAGALLILYAYVKVTPYGIAEVTRLYSYDPEEGRLSYFTSREGTSTIMFARGGLLYIGHTPPRGQSYVLVFDIKARSYIKTLETVPGAFSPINDLLVDSHGDVWFSEAGYFGVCGGRIWSRSGEVVAMCEAGDEIWMCSRAERTELIIVDLSRATSLLAIRLPSYIMGFPSTAFIPVASGAASASGYVLVDKVLGHIRYKRWLRERRGQPGSRAG